MSGLPSGSLSSIQNKPPGEKWLFNEEELLNTPSRRDKITAEKELNYRQQAANLIQDMGQRLPVNQLTINTAIVYMHRFYMFHSFHAFARFAIAPTALFLAAKVEEQPRKLEHVIRVCHSCLHPDKPHLDVHSDNYLKQAQQLVENELIMLQTLGFDISIDHPHTHVVKCTQLVKASRDLSQMAYFMATNSLHLTTFCLKYKPTVVSAMCIHLSCKWSNYEIPLSSEGKAYWAYMDPTITEALLENIINEFLKILNLCPTRLRKLKNYRPSREGAGGSTPQSKDGHQLKPASKVQLTKAGTQPGVESRRPGSGQLPPSEPHKKPTPTSEHQKKPTASITIAEYLHKKELQQNKQAISAASNPPTKPTTGPTNAMKQPPVTEHSVASSSQHHSIKSEKNYPKTANHLKRPEKAQNPHGQKLPPQASGLPVSGKQKHPAQHPTVHGGSSLHKEHPKSQSHAQHNRPPHPIHHHTKPQPKHKEQPMVKRELQELESVSKNRTDVNNASEHADDNLLAGMEQKVIEQMKAEKARETAAKPIDNSGGAFSKPNPAAHQAVATQLHHAKEHKSRHSMPNLPPRKEHPAANSQTPVGKTYKILYEQYKKNPEALRQQLKQKAQHLTEEEKQIWRKLKRKEEEKRQKRKKKPEKHKLNRSQPVEGRGSSEKGDVTSGGGLTVRIKLPPAVRAEISKNQASTSGSGGGPHIGSSSGSGSETVLSSPGGTISKAGRKRTHTHDSSGLSDPISAKHSKKSEGHHHHQSHHTSHDSSRHRHRHSQSGSHQSKSQHAGHKVYDDSTFQQALVDAVSIVQSGQAAPGMNSSDKTIPTVTLKRTGVQNGSGDSYVAHSSKHEKSKASRRSKQLGFDPSAPISATPPENLFDADANEPLKLENHSVATTKEAEVSSPETGEIIDDDDASPLRDHFSEQSNYSQRQHTSTNNNTAQSHHYQQWGSTTSGGSYPNPPSLTPSSAKVDSHKTYDSRLPPLPPLTVKPNRADQR